MPWWKPWAKVPDSSRLAVLAPPPDLPPRAPDGRSVALLVPMGDGGIAHPGHGLTAETIRAAFVQAEAGYPAMQCDLFDDVLERDAHLRAAVDGRIESVAGKRWIVQAGGDEPADHEAAHLLERALRAVPNVHETWEHLLTASFYGYAASEVIWDHAGALTVPVWFANVPHRRFRLAPETDAPAILTEASTTEGVPLERGRWIFARRRHRHTVRAGLLRTAVWWSFVKHLSLRDWQVFSARFGIPFILGRYPESSAEEVIKKLKETIVAFGRGGGAALPTGVSFEVVSQPAPATGADSVHAALVDVCNRELSKLVTGATLTTGEGTSAGSYALGRVHADRSFDLTMGDAERLGSVVCQDLGAAFVRFNGLRAQPPRLKVRVVREQDPATRMKLLAAFVNELGGELDEDQVRDEFDLKRPSGTASLRGLPPRPAKGQPS